MVAISAMLCACTSKTGNTDSPSGNLGQADSLVSVQPRYAKNFSVKDSAGMRLPQALTAIVAGAGLAVSGLQMQTVFRNPLAGPSVLGISNGSALGVAFVVLLSGRIGGVALSRLGYLGDAAMSVAAIIGALAVMLLISRSMPVSRSI